MRSRAGWRHDGARHRTPDGRTTLNPAATPRTCSLSSIPSWGMDHQGNGTYTVTVTTYTDTSCDLGAKTTR